MKKAQVMKGKNDVMGGKPIERRWLPRRGSFTVVPEYQSPCPASRAPQKETCVSFPPRPHARPPHLKYPLGGPLHDVVRPGPRLEVEPGHGEEYVHLLGSIVSRVGDDGRRRPGVRVVRSAQPFVLGQGIARLVRVSFTKGQGSYI